MRRIVGIARLNRRGVAKRAAFAWALVLILLILVPAASADFGRVYEWRVLMAPSHDYTDNVYHNHHFNEIYFSAGATWASEIYEVTPMGAVHYYKSGSGNLQFNHPGVYYDTPFCGNRDVASHTADCTTAWG